MRISDWSSDVCSSDLSLAENSQDSISTLYIVLPLWSGGSTNAQVDIAKARQKAALAELAKIRLALGQSTLQADRKSVVSGKSVSVRVDLGGRRNIKTKTSKKHKDL